MGTIGAKLGLAQIKAGEHKNFKCYTISNCCFYMLLLLLCRFFLGYSFTLEKFEEKLLWLG